MYITDDEDFLEFCRAEFDILHVIFLKYGYQNFEDFECFLERNYAKLENDYINSIERTIH